MRTIALSVNDKPVTAAVEPRMHVGDFLRERLNLTGTHLGCEHGVCGACTVLIDGAPARACITLAVACEGAAITTVEGLDGDELAAELRAAFAREHALQCGYCTPGMLIAARDAAIRLASGSERDIRMAMSGNLCRCTGYVGIVRAVGDVIAARRARGIAGDAAAGRTQLGPVGSGHATEPQAASTELAAPAIRRVAAQTAAISRESELPTDFTPQAAFEQSVVIAQPREKVWAFLGDIRAVAECLPGVSLTAEPTERRAEGKMRVKVGPMLTEFHGVAQISRDPSTWSGTIVGSGTDPRSRSATRGRIRYRLLPSEHLQSTVLEIGVAYAVSGTFAQFSRSGLIQEIARRLTATFVQNMEARLAGKELPAGRAELKAGALVLAAAKAKVIAGLRRLFRR